MPLLYISVAWLTGTFTGSLIALPVWVLAAGLAVLIPAFFLRNHRRAIIILGLCLLSLVGGAIRYQSSIPAVDSSSLQFYNNKGVARVQGMVSNSPETKNSSLEFRLSANLITVDNQATTIKGDILVHLPFYRQLHYGDILQLTGKPETPPQFDDFDYRNYLSNQGIYSIMNYPRVEVLEVDQGFMPLSWIYYLRSRLAESLSACLPEPHGSLAQAILLGIRGNLPQPLVQFFYSTGTTHLIAISGMNLTIILGMLLPLTIRLFGRKNRIYIWLSLALIWLYTVLTGLPPTMVRATIMGSVFLVAELLGRQRNAVAAISFAGAVMVAYQPHVLWDASFQLSFLSMLGLIFISHYLIHSMQPEAVTGSNKYLQSIKGIMITGFGTTMAAIIATWPVTALDFRSFSLVGAPATFFAMPSFPPIILTSMLTSFTGTLWQPSGILFGWVSWLFLSYFILVVNLFGAIPVAYITHVAIQPWQAISYYGALAALLIMLNKRQAVSFYCKRLYEKVRSVLSGLKAASLKPYIYWALAILVVANTLVWTAYATVPDGKLHVSVLDVGQGESILIRTPDGQNIVVDTGPDPLATCTALGKKLPFWDKQIDLLILTQMQADHITGTFELLRKYDVRMVALSPYNIDSALSRELLKTTAKTPVKIETIYEGQQLDLGHNIRISVLNPPYSLRRGTEDDANNNSVALRLSWDNTSFLLTSDMGMDAERCLIDERADLHSEVLKVGHHGSKGSTSDEFLAIVNPSAAVISCGAVNRFGHPNKEVMDKLNERIGAGNVFVTATSGTVEFTTDGHRLWYQVDNIKN